MLEGLDAINWREIKHWWGTAEDIPDLIRGLASPDKAQREAAYSDLENKIAHQQELCQVSPAVAPFLVELLDENIEDKHFIIYLLTDLACGGYYDERSKHWSEESYAKVAIHKSKFESYLSHPDGKVQRATKSLLWGIENREQKRTSELDGERDQHNHPRNISSDDP